MKRILILVPTLMLLSSCTESYDMSYEELNDRYRMLDSEYSSLKEHCDELEEELYYHERECVSYDEYDELKRSLEEDYIHKDSIHNYILYHSDEYIHIDDIDEYIDGYYD